MSPLPTYLLLCNSLSLSTTTPWASLQTASPLSLPFLHSNGQEGERAFTVPPPLLPTSINISPNVLLFHLARSNDILAFLHISLAAGFRLHTRAGNAQTSPRCLNSGYRACRLSCLRSRAAALPRTGTHLAVLAAAAPVHLLTSSPPPQQPHCTPPPSFTSSYLSP